MTADGILRSSIEDTTTTVLVDDITEIRYLARLLLANVRGVQVVGEGANGKDVIELAERLRPELMLLDLEMPEMSGLEALPEIRRVSPSTRIIVWTGQVERRDECLRAGADEVVRKGGDPQLVVDAVRATLSPLGARW